MTQLYALNGQPASRVCYGCMQFGGTADFANSTEMFHDSRAAGVNFFDTAHVYTGGVSETWLGQLAGPTRDALIIATKAAYQGGSGADNILRSFDESRARLGMDSVDVLYLHRWDADTPLAETFDALARLQSDGAIRYIGVSNFAAWQVMKAQTVAQSFGTRIDILQPMYSLVKRQAEVELLPMALSEGFGVAPYSPLGAGLLTGKYGAGATAQGPGRLSDDARYGARYGPDWMWTTARALTDLAAELGQSPATLAVAWAARHPGVTAPIISARSAAQLVPSLAALTYTLTDEVYARMAALSPTPAPATDRLEEASSA